MIFRRLSYLKSMYVGEWLDALAAGDVYSISQLHVLLSVQYILARLSIRIYCTEYP